MIGPGWEGQKAPSTTRCIKNWPQLLQQCLVPEFVDHPPWPQRVATRKLHEFVQELGTCLHGMNEELSATIEN